MYVCICNALTEKHIEESISAGSTTVSKVFKSYQCEMRCKKCGPEIKQKIKELKII